MSTPVRITVESLRPFNPCLNGLSAFERAFPRGIRIASTPRGRARQARACANLDVNWAAEKLLRAPALAEYERVTAQAFLDAYYAQETGV